MPCTLQVEGRHPALHVNSLQPLSRYGAKVGSLQAWVKHDDTASDRGTATFPVHEVTRDRTLTLTATFPRARGNPNPSPNPSPKPNPDQVHKIAILDMRLLNSDR